MKALKTVLVIGFLLIPRMGSGFYVVEESGVERMGLTARPMGTGAAGVATQNDVNALIFNPAGLVNYSQTSYHFITSPMEEGVRYYGVSYAAPFWSQGGMAFSYRRLDYGDLETYQVGTNTTGVFTASDQVVTAGFGFPIVSPRKMSGGLSLRYRVKQIAGQTASGAGIDAGFLFPLLHYPGFQARAGVAVQELVPMKLTYMETSENKRMYRVGLEMSAPIQHIKNTLANLRWEMVRPEGLDAAHIIGGELRWQFFSVMAGVQDKNFGFGMGFYLDKKNNSLRLDYGVSMRLNTDCHGISLTWHLKPRDKNHVQSKRMDKAKKRWGKQAYQKAEHFYHKGAYWEASEKYQEAFAWQPHRLEWESKAKEAKRLAKQQDNKKAIQSLVRTAEALEAQGDYESALLAWGRVLIMDPEYRAAMKAEKRLAKRLTKKQKKQVKTKTRGLKKKALFNNAAYIQKLIQNKNWPELSEKWPKFIGMSRKYPEIYDTAIRIHQKIKQVIEQALNQAALSLQQENWQEAQKNMRVVNLMDHDNPKLAELKLRLSKGIQQKKTKENVTHEWLMEEFSLAVRAFYQEENYAKAKRHLDKILEKDPSFQQAAELLEKIERLTQSTQKSRAF